MGTEAFLANPMLQYRASQSGEHDYSAYNKRKRDSYRYPSLSHLRMNINFKENGGKKSFSCKFKATISHIPMQRT